jgi:hypothetical protein
MNIWQVLVSSPGDVIEERNFLSHAVDTVNSALHAANKPRRLQLRKWETDVPPGLHREGGQGQIESKLHFADCDILIGILWKRFGTPVLGNLSGTEREILQACAAWRSNSRPKVMLFFCTAPTPMPTTLEEVEQLRRVIEFKEKVKREGLIREYSDPHDFERMVTRYLLDECLGADDAQHYLRSSLSCSVISYPLEVRGEGRTERVGDLRLLFASAGANDPQSGLVPETILVDIDVHLNIAIVWNEGAPGPILILDELEQPIQQSVGRRIAPNIVRFGDVPIRSSLPTSAIITNIRADALGLAIAMSGPRSRIVAGVRARDGFRDVDIVHETVTVAEIHGQSFLFSTEQPWPMKIPLAGIQVPLAQEDCPKIVAPTFTILFSERFPGVFKNRAEEAGIAALRPDQVANSGTRLMLVLGSLPDGIAVYAAAHDHGDDTKIPTVRLVQKEPDKLLVSGERSKPFLATSRGVELVQLEVTDRSTVAVWEWVRTAHVPLDSRRTVKIDIFFSGVPDIVPGTGTVYATAALAPVSHEKASDSLPVPCFGALMAARSLLSIE